MLFQAAQPTISTVLDRCISAEKAHPRQSLVITADSTIPGNAPHSVVTISMDRAARRVLIRLQTTSRSGMRFDRTYFVSGSRLQSYDHQLNQYLYRPLLESKSLGENLISELRLDPSAILVLDPATTDSALFKGLRALPNWTISSKPTVSISRSSSARGGNSTIRASFDRTMLPVSLYFGSNGKAFKATYRYEAPPSRIDFSPPASAKEVAAFRAAPPPPRYADAATESVARRCKSAYDSIKSLKYEVQGGSGTSTVYWAGRLAREDSARISWADDGQTLSIVDKSNRTFYRGNAGVDDAPDYLLRLGVRPDQTLRSLLSGQNLLTDLFGAGYSARLAGRITLRGVPCDILELSSPLVRTQVQVRADNHLIAGLLSESLDADHHVVSRSERTFAYRGIDERMARSVFRLTPPTGFRIRPLSALKRN